MSAAPPVLPAHVDPDRDDRDDRDHDAPPRAPRRAAGVDASAPDLARDGPRGGLPGGVLRGSARAAGRVRRALRTRAGQVALVVGPAAVVGALALSMNRAAARERLTGERVAHTHEVRATLAMLLARLSDAETGQRGYLLTGRRDFLAPYHEGHREVPVRLARLRALTRDNPVQQARLDTLERVARARLQLLDSTLALREAGRGGDAVRLVAAGRGHVLMDEARALGERLDDEEQRLLTARRAAARESQRRAVGWLVLGSTGVVAVALLTNYQLVAAARAESRTRAALARRTQRLERTEARLHAALEAGRTGTWEWDRTTRRIEWSAMHDRLFGHRADAVNGEEAAFLALVLPEDRQGFVDALAHARTTGREYAHEFRVRRADGAITWLLGRGHYVYAADGTPERAVGTVTDVTAQKAADVERARLEAELRAGETMAAIGTVAAGVAHEVRNPLFGISSMLDALDASFPDRPELTPFVERLRAQVVRVSDLMADLLEYGRPARQELAPTPLGPVLAEAIANCAPTIARHAVVVDAAFDAAALPPVAMDRRRLVRVFQNLLENAAQHTPAGGDVRLVAEVEEGGEWIACRTVDRGSGIPDEQLPRLFEPFFTRRRGGTGLGLSIVQRIVQEHGGTIAAANGPQGGAVFTVRLPVARS
jgi:PAS domain S-box-containing protein